MSMSLCFNEVQLSPVNLDNQIWIRSGELARALGYSDEKAINKIYARNEDEFNSGMSQVIDINGGGNLTPIKFRVFSLRGCHLIAMFARTAVAKAFRKWVLDVLDKLAVEAPAAQPAIPSALTPSTAADRSPLDKLVKVWAQQSGTVHAQAWTQVNAHFNLNSVAQLPVEWIPDAIAFVEGKINALATIEAKPEPALCSVRPDATIMDDIRAFSDEVEHARQKNIEMQQHLFNLISKLMARIGIQYIGKYDTPDAVGFAVNGVYYQPVEKVTFPLRSESPIDCCGKTYLTFRFD